MSKKLENSVPKESDLLDQLFNLTPTPETTDILKKMCRNKNIYPTPNKKRMIDFWNSKSCLPTKSKLIFTPLVKLQPPSLVRRNKILFVRSSKKSEGTIELYCGMDLDDRIPDLFESCGHTAHYKESYNFNYSKFSVPSLDVLIPILCFMKPKERSSINKVVCHGSKEYLKEVKTFI